MTIVAEGVVAPKKSNPLELTEEKKSEMVAKAKELLGEQAMEYCELYGSLEQFYVKLNEHYTSEQLKGIINQVEEELMPEPTPEEL